MKKNVYCFTRNELSWIRAHRKSMTLLQLMSLVNKTRLEINKKLLKGKGLKIFKSVRTFQVLLLKEGIGDRIAVNKERVANNFKPIIIDGVQMFNIKEYKELMAYCGDQKNL